MKKFATLLFISIALILAAVTLLFFYLRTDHAIHLLTNRVNQSIPGRIQARSWDISLFPLSIGLFGIEVEGPDQKQCVAVESIEAIIDLSSLFDGTIEIRSLAIRKPQIDLARDEQGSVNIVNAFVSPGSRKDKGAEKADSKSSLPVNILVQKAKVDQGTLVFKDPAGRIHLSGINLRLFRFDMQDKSFSLSFETGRGSGTIRGETIAISGANMAASFDPKTGAKLEAAVQTDLFTLKSSGQIFSFTRNPKVQIDLHAESRLGVISRFKESYAGPQGDVILSLAASGALNNPDVEFEIKMPELSGPGAAKAKAVDVNAVLSERVLTIERANLDLLGTTVRAKGSVDLSKTFPKGFLEPGFDLNKTEYDLSFSQNGMDAELLEPWVNGLSGRFSAKGSVFGKGIHPDGLDGRYSILLTAEDFKPPGPGQPVSHVRLSASGEIKDHILTVNELTARTPDAETRVSGQVDIRKQQVRGTLTAESRDLLSTLSVAGIHMLEGSMEGKIDFSGDLFHPSLDARIKADNLAVEGIVIERVELDASLFPSGKAIIRKLEAAKGSSTVRLAGDADIFKKGFLLNESIDADFTITGNNLSPARITDWANLEMETGFLPSRVDWELAGRVFCNLSDFTDKSS
ncbi:MAG: AsmA family protein, partial [Desulfarculaceae bacterium]|nr:AsmA family protein [Desulfarculaceae bacterium]